MTNRLVLLIGLCTAFGCRTSAPVAQKPIPHAEIPLVRQVAFEQELSSGGNEVQPMVTEQTGIVELVPFENSGQSAMTANDVDTASKVRLETVNDQVASLDQCVALAISVSPSIRKLEAEIEALKGKHCQAGLGPNPTIGINGEDINEDGSPGRYGIYYGNTIVRGNKLALSQNVVCHEIRQAEMELVELRQRLATDVKLRYFDILIAISKYELVTQLVSLSREAVEATQQLLEAKEIARTALIQAELEMQNALTQQLRAQNQLTAARRNLAALIGEPDLPYASFAGSLAEANPMEIETQFERLLNASPELARLNASIDVAKSNLSRQRVQCIGDLSWQTSVSYDLASDDVVSGFQIGLPLPKCNRNQGAIYQARQEIVAAVHDVEMRTLQLRQRLVESFQTYRDAKVQVQSYESEVLPRARKSLELITEGYQQGEVDFLQLLTAQRTYFQFNLAVIEQQGIMWQQRIAVEGMLLSGSLDPR